MKKNFAHLVLTRFNTAVGGYAPFPKRLDADWLRTRLALFRRYCLPSMETQRNATFQWVIFCDTDSPLWFRKEMASFEPLARSIYVEGALTDERMASLLARDGFASKPYLITTRLDNDDAIACDHLAAVQSEFAEQEREFVTFPVGMQLYRGHLYNMVWSSNPFLSLIEKVGCDGHFSTVCCVSHTRVHSAGRVRSRIRPPAWLQVIHGDNLGNSLRGWPRIRSRSHPGFEIRWPEAEHSDSLAQRMLFTTAAYGTRAKRWLNRHTHVLAGA
jgi:hypothetical protein